MCSNFIYNKIFLLKLFTTFVFLSAFHVIGAQQQEDLAELTLNPTQCVSLQQNQVCFISVELNWQTVDVGDYCVSSSKRQAPLKCWSSASQGAYSQEIKMDKDVVYTLTTKANNKVLASRTLQLAWVYREEKFSHSSWRIF